MLCQLWKVCAIQVKIRVRNFKDMREIKPEKSCFPRITFCESLFSNVESPFLGLADVEVTNNHSKRLEVARPMRRNKTWSFTQVL